MRILYLNSVSKSITCRPWLHPCYPARHSARPKSKQASSKKTPTPYSLTTRLPAPTYSKTSLSSGTRSDNPAHTPLVQPNTDVQRRQEPNTTPHSDVHIHRSMLTRISRNPFSTPLLPHLFPHPPLRIMRSLLHVPRRALLAEKLQFLYAKDRERLQAAAAAAAAAAIQKVEDEEVL